MFILDADYAYPAIVKIQKFTILFHITTHNTAFYSPFTLGVK